MSNFVQIDSVGGELCMEGVIDGELIVEGAVGGGGQTDRQDGANCRFSRFCERT